MNLYKYCFIFCFIFCSSVSYASIIIESNSIIDEQTGLEWLNLNETANISYDQLLIDISNGGYENFSIASNDQLLNLMSSYNLLSGTNLVGNSLYDNWANILPSNNSPYDLILSAPISNSTFNPGYIFSNGNYRNQGITQPVPITRICLLL